MPPWLANLLGGGIIDKVLAFIPNPEEKAKAQAQLQTAIIEAGFKAEADQREINKAEAASGSMFVAGWRPAVGWLCVLVLAADWLVYPLLSWLAGIAGWHLPPWPHLGNQDTQALLWALLGIGTLRSAEKLTGSPMTSAISGFLGSRRQ